MSPDAVHTQLWIAVRVYVLIAIVRRKLRLQRALAEMLQIASLTLSEKTPPCEVSSRAPAI